MGLWIAITMAASASASMTSASVTTAAGAAAPGPASAMGLSSDPATAGFSLTGYTAAKEADAHRRYLLPAVADRYGAPKPPAKLRIRGRRLKLRVPIG